MKAMVLRKQAYISEGMVSSNVFDERGYDLSSSMGEVPRPSFGILDRGWVKLCGKYDWEALAC